MVRRSFFRMIGAVAAGGGVVKSVAMEAPQPLFKCALDAILAHKSDNPIYWNSWQLCWTGWKADLDSVTVAGQWIAIPVTPDGSRDRSREMLYVSHPGGYGMFKSGEVFNLSGRWTQESAYTAAPGKFGKVQDLMEPYRRAPLRLLLELIDAQPWPALPFSDNRPVPWSKLSARSRVYVDPLRVFREMGLVDKSGYLPVPSEALTIAERLRDDCLFG